MTGNEIQSFQMIRVGMSENEVVDFPNLLGPQKGGNHPLTDVESVVSLTSPIDQHSFSAREFDQYRVAVGHINKGEHEILLKSMFDVPVDSIENENKGQTDEENAYGSSPSQMNCQEEEKIK